MNCKRLNTKRMWGCKGNKEPLAKFVCFFVFENTQVAVVHLREEYVIREARDYDTRRRAVAIQARLRRVWFEEGKVLAC